MLFQKKGVCWNFDTRSYITKGISNVLKYQWLPRERIPHELSNDPAPKRYVVRWIYFTHNVNSRLPSDPFQKLKRLKSRSIVPSVHIGWLIHCIFVQISYLELTPLRYPHFRPTKSIGSGDE